jgi:hypothetical protein
MLNYYVMQSNRVQTTDIWARAVCMLIAEIIYAEQLKSTGAMATHFFHRGARPGLWNCSSLRCLLRHQNGSEEPLLRLCGRVGVVSPISGILGVEGGWYCFRVLGRLEAVYDLRNLQWVLRCTTCVRLISSWSLRCCDKTAKSYVSKIDPEARFSQVLQGQIKA